MSVYLDTSFIVAALSNEAMGGPVRAWLRDQTDTRLLIGEWTITEMSSALSIKLRSGRIDQIQRAAVLATFRRMVSDSLNVVPVLSEDFVAAAQIADQHELGIRAGDALHLAITKRLGASLATLDVRMAVACPTIGIAVQSDFGGV